jgi:hypothetical protein
MKLSFLLILFVFILSSCSNPNINSQTYDKTATNEHWIDKDTINKNAQNSTKNNKNSSVDENNKENSDNVEKHDNKKIASNSNASTVNNNSTNNSSDKISTVFFGSVGFVIDDAEKETEDETEEEEIKEKMVYKLASQNHFSSGSNAPNTDPVCQAYVDALNNYPLVDFFEAPMQPDTDIFSYPKWEQFDIYEHKDIYLRIRNGYNSYENFIKSKPELEKDWYMEDNVSEDNRKSTRWRWQMYYTRADINNDNVTDDIIRLDSNRYVNKPGAYYNYLIIFNDYPEKSFKDMDIDLSKKLDYENIQNFFFYKGKTYIKEIVYYVPFEEFDYMLIQEFNDKNELINLCFIGDYNAKSQTD